MLLTAKSFAIEINEQNAFVSSLVLQGKDLLSVPKERPLFSLIALDKAKTRVTLIPKNGKAQGDLWVYEQMFCETEVVAIRATLKVQEKNDAMAFSVRIENNSDDYCVIETLFELSGLTFGQDEKTALFYPHHAGEKILNPTMKLRSEKYQNFWRAGTKKINGEWVRECNYCGLCSMSYMFLQNEGAGLYIGSHDPRFPVTGLIVKTGGENTEYLSLGFRVYKRILQFETWESGEFTINVSNNMWHEGAKRYRSWISPYLSQHQDPVFLRNQAALNQCYNFKRVDDIQNRFSNIPAMWEAGNKLGINHMFIASWNRTGFDSFYPEYYPDMELGTALDFKRGIEYINLRGGFATLYVNARLSDMSSDFHKRFLSKMQIENEHGKALTETYGPHTFTLNCPSDEQWQHMLVDICDFAVQSYGAKGIYLDQLASAEPFACYNNGHTHQDIGEFNLGYLKILSELLDRLRARDKDAYLMTENCGDIYSPHVWGNLTWNGTDYDEFYNLYRYTFPEFVQVNMCNDRSWIENVEEKDTLFYSDIERCVLMGNILWIGITSRYHEKPESKQHFDYVMLAAAFRKTIAEQVNSGVFLDDEFVDKIDEPLKASCFSISDTEALLLVGDCHKVGGKVSFKLPFIVRSAVAYDESNSLASVILKDNYVTVIMEGARLVRITVRLKG